MNGRLFALGAVALMLLSALCVPVLYENEIKAAGGNGTFGSPLESLTGSLDDIADEEYWIKVGGTVSLSQDGECEAYSLTDGYGLTRDGNGITGTISKSGDITISLFNVAGSENFTCTIHAVAVSSGSSGSSGSSNDPLASLTGSLDDVAGGEYWVKVGGTVRLIIDGEYDLITLTSGYGLTTDGDGIIGTISKSGDIIIQLVHTNNNQTPSCTIHAVDITGTSDNPLSSLSASAEDVSGKTFYIREGGSVSILNSPSVPLYSDTPYPAGSGLTITSNGISGTINAGTYVIPFYETAGNETVATCTVIGVGGSGGNQPVDTHTVTVRVGSNGGYLNGNGTTSVTIQNVPDGSTISSNGSVLTVGDAHVSAVKQHDLRYSWFFNSWNIPGNGTVTSDMTVTAVFSQIDRGTSSEPLSVVDFNMPDMKDQTFYARHGVSVTVHGSSVIGAVPHLTATNSVKTGGDGQTSLTVTPSGNGLVKITFERGNDVTNAYVKYVTNIALHDAENVCPVPVYTYTSDDDLNLPTLTKNGKVFGGWRLDSANGTAVNETNIKGDVRDLYANWTSSAPSTHTVTVSANAGGTVSRASVTATDGASVSASGNILTVGTATVTATANSGYEFVSWTGIPAGGTITADCTITASFRAVSQPEAVTLTGVPDDISIAAGKSTTFSYTVTPAGTAVTATGTGITATVANGTVTVTAQNTGDFTLTLTPAGGTAKTVNVHVTAELAFTNSPTASYRIVSA